MNIDRMIRMMLAMMALAIISSCVSIEKKTDLSSSEEINFSVHILKNQNLTKASSPDESSVERYGNDVTSVTVSPMSIDSSFSTKSAQITDIKYLGTSGIFAFYTSDGGTSFTTYMNNQEIIYSTSDGSSSYSPVKYWPVADGTTSYLNFYGYSPYLTPGSAGANGLLLTAGSDPKVSYETPASSVDQPDFMIAARQTNKKKGNPIEAVYQNFRHALSCVAVQVYGNGQAIYSIKLKSINKKGEITLSSVTGSSVLTWALDGTTSDFEAAINFDAGKTYATDNPVTSDIMSGYFMLLPQTLSDDAKLVIDYEVNPESGTHTTKEIPLKQGGLTAWEAGNCYNYQIIITPYTHFSVTPAVNEYSYAGGQTEYVVNSYYIAGGTTNKVSLAWNATCLDWDTESAVSQPAWLNLSSGLSGPGGFAMDYDATIAPQIPSAYSTEDGEIRAETPKTDYDLSEGGTKTANCYVVNAAGTYKFPANVMGNGAAGWYAGAVDYSGALISTPAINTSNSYAKLLWQDVPGAIVELSLTGDYINFKTAPQNEIFQANASIAIVNQGPDLTPGTDDDVIMWSWHIWITNLKLSTSTFDINFGTPYTMLRYPIGYRNPATIQTLERKIKVKFVQDVHLSAQPDVVVSFKQNGANTPPTHSVLYYQAGRKDPFVPTAPFTDATGNMYDFYNNEITYAYTTSLLSGLPFNIGWSHSLESSKYSIFIKYPVLYEIRNKNTWSVDISNNIGKYWGAISNSKTIYDPSPYGYKVPPVGTFKGVTKKTEGGPINNGYTLCINNDATPGTVFLPTTGDIYRASVAVGVPPALANKNHIFLLMNDKSNYSSVNDMCLIVNTNPLISTTSIAGDNVNNRQANSYGKSILPVKYIP